MVDHSFAIHLCFAICFKIGIKRFLNGTVNLLWTESNFLLLFKVTGFESGRSSKWAVFKMSGLGSERPVEIIDFPFLSCFVVSNWSNHFCQRPSTLDRSIQQGPCLTDIFERAVPISISSMCKTNRFVWLGSGDGFELEFFTCLFFSIWSKLSSMPICQVTFFVAGEDFRHSDGNTVGLTDDQPTKSHKCRLNSLSEFVYDRQWGSWMKIVT